MYDYFPLYFFFYAVISDRDKESLVFHMAYGREMPQIGNFKEILHKRHLERAVRQAGGGAQREEDRFEECKCELIQIFLLLHECLLKPSFFICNFPVFFYKIIPNL